MPAIALFGSVSRAELPGRPTRLADLFVDAIAEAASLIGQAGWHGATTTDRHGSPVWEACWARTMHAAGLKGFSLDTRRGFCRRQRVAMGHLIAAEEAERLE